MKIFLLLYFSFLLSLGAESDREYQYRANRIKDCFDSICKNGELAEKMIPEVNTFAALGPDDARTLDYVNTILVPLRRQIESEYIAKKSEYLQNIDTFIGQLRKNTSRNKDYSTLQKIIIENFFNQIGRVRNRNITVRQKPSITMSFSPEEIRLFTIIANNYNNTAPITHVRTKQVGSCSANCRQAIDTLINNFSVMDKLTTFFDKYTNWINQWCEQCDNDLKLLQINEKYLIDIESIKHMKDKVYEFWKDHLSDETMANLLREYQQIDAKCDYQKNTEQTFLYIAHQEGKNILKSMEEMKKSYDLFDFFKHYNLAMQSFPKEPIKCNALSKLRLEKYPKYANIDGSGDSFFKEESTVIFSNQSCRNKDSGKGVMAHEFTHVITHLYTKQSSPSQTSTNKLKKIRTCLAFNYKERTTSHTGFVRIPEVDELTTEEDFADLARFKLSTPIYLDGCSYYDFALNLFPTEEKRRLYKIYDFSGNSNPHSVPIYRLLHELKYQNIELTPQCKIVESMASSTFVIRNCLDEIN